MLLSGVSFAWTYYLSLEPLVRGGFARFLQLLGEFNITSIIWWRDFLDVAFDLLIAALFVVAFIWVWGNFAVSMHEFRKWRKVKPKATVERFNIWQRIQHVWVIVTFAICAFTGYVMYFGNNPYWQFLYVSRELYVTIHVISGVLLGIVIAYHFFHYSVRGLIALYRRELLKSLPIVGLFTLSMIKESIRNFLYFVTPKVGKPRYHKYDFEQYFEYWGVYWGVAVLGIPGAVMAIWGPSVLSGLFWVTHVKEAALAVLWIIFTHFGSTHFAPKNFPLDDTFITGKMPVERVKEEHPLWYEELVKEGKIKPVFESSGSSSSPLTGGESS